jgi:hypothetical protein
MAKLTVLCAFLALAGTGCESGSPGASSDSTLAGIAAEEGAALAGVFGIPQPNMDDISIEWGRLSEYNDTDNYYRITIREDLAGQDEALRCHVRHEMFHAMTGLRDGEELTYNGVRIAGVVAWEG